MDLYALSKKEIAKYEKEFSKTVLGQRARLLALLPTLLLVLWIMLVVTKVSLTCLCYKCWGWSCYGWAWFDFDTIMIAFLIIVSLCIFSAANLNKEFRKYLQSKKD